MYGTSAGLSQTTSSNAYSPSATTIAAAPENVLSLTGTLSDAEQRLCGLHDAIDRLESRLQSVTQPAPPRVEKGNAVGGPTPIQTRLLSRVQMINDGLSAAYGRIEELTKRLEV